MNHLEKTTAAVMAVHRDRYELWADGIRIHARLKTANFYNTREIPVFPTVGDEVEIACNETGDSLIERVLPRKSVFMRLNATKGLPDQAVAANFDYVFITMSLNRDFHISKLERYLTVAWQSGGEPVVILTKADLCENQDTYRKEAEKVAQGANIFCISSVTGQGISALEPYLQKGKTIVLLGSSGVGKSSFINMLTGREEMQTGGIREADAQGRHTTTYRQCMFLPEIIKLPDGSNISGGARMIDTPGMRKLIISEAEEGMQASFEDIEELTHNCRFSDCRHAGEPGCAVKKALEDGTLSKKRWKTYQQLRQEEAYARERNKIIKERSEKIRHGKYKRHDKGANSSYYN